MSAPPAILIFVVDLAAARELLEADEGNTPRLAAEETARFNHKVSALGDDDARDWRAAHIALRIILERETSTALRGVPYDRAPGGRPRIPRSLGLARYPEFSLAHAGATALIGVSHDDVVGVDIEASRDIRMSDERRARVIGAAARLAPELALPESSDARLLQAWVRLEAIAKATSLGIGRILTEAGVVGGSKPESSGAEPSHDFCLSDLEVGLDRFAAVAAPRLPQTIAIHTFATDAAALAAFKTKRA